VAAATAAFATVVVGALPFHYALPLIGLFLAFGAPPETTPTARTIDASRRNIVIGVLVLAITVAVVLRPQLMLPLAIVFGLDVLDLVLALLPVAVLALPLALTDSATPVEGLPSGRLVLTRRNVILSLTVLVTVAVWYVGPGISFLPIALLVLALPIVLAVSRLWRARQGLVDGRWWRRPRAAGARWHLVQAANVALLCALLGCMMLPGTFDILRASMSAGWYQAFQIGYLAALVALVSLTLVPLRQVRAGTNLLVLAASVLVAVQLVTTYQAPAQPVTVSSPLSGQWYVGQGGHAELVNYHHVTTAQRDALDILQVVDGQTHPASSTALDSYYIYGEPLLAPVDGVVTSVVDGLADQPIGSVDPDPANQAGNQVVIDAGAGRYIMVGHIRPGTIRVAVGDRVGAGQVIAQVGNSGNTDEPHIHIQAQNLPELDLGTDDPIGVLRSIRTFPLVFRDVALTRGGTVSTPAVADPRRGDLVSPVG
jgi:hypothetical protein